MEILPVKCIRGMIFMESKLLKIFYDMSAIYRKGIRVIFKHVQGKGILVITREGSI
jgi:hypothetical protein